ncbi:MAG TPA: hypothetical protein VKZ63_06385 [Kofleriaceae bacterium]|nr:hypothetical protein [Kofleriaceae bacterium]
MHRTSSLRVALSLSLAAAFLLAAAAESAHAQRVRANRVKLGRADQARLSRTATRFEREIRAKYTPVVDLHITQRSQDAGVRFRKVKNPRRGDSGPTVFEVTGVDKAGGEIEMVLSGGASGHVMQPKYGGRPMSVVEGYGKSDTVYLTHKRPGASRSTEVVKVQSRGLVTQEGFKVKLEKGTHHFYYFRGGPNERSGGEGSEPELRQVTIHVK